MVDPINPQVLAKELINSESTMAIGTAGEGTAWVAPVYYVFFQGAMYFFSSPDSRHIQESLKSGQAAATIYPSSSSWKVIRGLQMSGRIQKVHSRSKGTWGGSCLCRQVSIYKRFFDTEEDVDLERIASRFRARLYRFDPDLVFYLDNKIRFGFREAIQL